MHLFDVFVARRDCVTSLEAVRHHPRVKHVTMLPRDWLFYEFYDDLFRDPDYLVEGKWERKMRDHPELRAARIQMLKEERGLLAPWYKTTNKMGDADSIAISEVGQYLIYSLGPLRMIDFEPSAAWGAGKAFSVTLHAPNTSRDSLWQLIRELELAGEGRVKLAGRLLATKEGFRFEAECEDYSGHWLVSLWVLLCDGRFNTGVSKVVAAVKADR